MIRLSINLNKIALIRNAREGNYPDLLSYARRCLESGAHGVTVHPRPDQRHIRAADVEPLNNLCADWPKVEFNIEGNPFAPAAASTQNRVGDYPGFLPLLESSNADQCTLVPDGNDQLTSDHGFDLLRDGDTLRPIISRCKSTGARVSLFMDPDTDQVKRAADIGADRIEFYTGPFAARYQQDPNDLALFEQYCAAAETALDCGLGVNAGHDLNLENLRVFKNLPGLAEVSIGHAFTVDCLNLGLQKALTAYLSVLSMSTSS